MPQFVRLKVHHREGYEALEALQAGILDVLISTKVGEGSLALRESLPWMEVLDGGATGSFFLDHNPFAAQ